MTAQAETELSTASRWKPIVGYLYCISTTPAGSWKSSTAAHRRTWLCRCADGGESAARCSGADGGGGGESRPGGSTSSFFQADMADFHIASRSGREQDSVV